MQCRLKNRIILCALWLIVFALGACSKWTEVESVKINTPNIKTQNPELYARYLENLRNYKNSDHKSVYVWFDNSEKKPFSRAHHLTDLPDSVDVVVLMHPGNLAEYELKDMENIRKDKGTKIITAINFDAVKLEYDSMLADKIKEDPTYVPTIFLDVLKDQVRSLLLNADKYGYDGVLISYQGKTISDLNKNELEEYTNNEKLFIGMIGDWCKRRKDKIMVFQGRPQNLVDKSILANCKLIILPSEDATNKDLFSYKIEMASVTDVPTDRFAIAVSTTSLDKADKKTGFLSGTTRALESAVEWSTAVYADFMISGIGIYNVSNDYFSTSLNYKYTRNAITTLNPPN